MFRRSQAEATAGSDTALSVVAEIEQAIHELEFDLAGGDGGDGFRSVIGSGFRIRLHSPFQIALQHLSSWMRQISDPVIEALCRIVLSLW